MKRHILTGAVMLMGLSTAAFAPAASAQDTSSVPGYPGVKVIPVEKSTPSTATATPQTDGTTVRKRLSTSLQEAGFTDVKIVPEAFLVEARNKSGDAVTMFLSPDSLTVFTARDPKGQSSQAATDGATATPSPK